LRERLEPAKLFLDLLPQVFGRVGHLTPFADELVQFTMQPIALALRLRRRRLERVDATLERGRLTSPAEPAAARAERHAERDADGESQQNTASRHRRHILPGGAAGPE